MSTQKLSHPNSMNRQKWHFLPIFHRSAAESTHLLYCFAVKFQVLLGQIRGQTAAKHENGTKKRLFFGLGTHFQNY